MKARKLSTALALAAMLGGCKSPPKADEAAPAASLEAAAPVSKPALSLDAALLVEQVQILRDREFERAPQLLPVADYTPPATCKDACRNERERLSDVLFGETLPQPRRAAHFDRAKNAVLYDASLGDAAELEFAIVASLVEGLDRQTGAPLPEPTSWDEYLARQAVARGPGIFVAALRRAQAIEPTVDASALAAHPETLYALAPEAVVTDFARREGFALTAAMQRSGGWSAVELLRNEPPASTAGVVRPDRYLEGADYGSWTFPESLDEVRQAGGWKLDASGRVGPAVSVEWLSRHVDARIARAAYLGLESDAYRVWRLDGQWSFEWVTLWNTPATAQQVVEIFERALGAQKKGRRYSVVRRGATIAVVGENSEADTLDLATGLVEARPSFQPRPGSGLAFVPTPADELGSNALEATLKENQWSDPATGLQADLRPLTAWKVQKTDESGIRWFARHADGSILELTTEVASILAPAPATDEAQTTLVQAFEKSVAVEGEVAAARVDQPSPGTVRLDLVGTTDEGSRRAFRVWHFATGPYLVTVSLQADPAALEARLAEVVPVVLALTVPTPQQDETPGGVIRFTVEE